MVIWRRLSISNGEKNLIDCTTTDQIWIFHNRQEQNDWIPLIIEFCSLIPTTKDQNSHTHNFSSLLSVWLFLSHDAKPTEKGSSSP